MNDKTKPEFILKYISYKVACPPGSYIIGCCFRLKYSPLQMCSPKFQVPLSDGGDEPFL